MGVIRLGANGGFRGKAGSVIGSSWKSIDYIKGLYKKRTKPASEEQLEQQARFRTIARFLMPAARMLNVGFSQVTAEKMTPINVALQYNIKEAVVGAYPDFELDYSKIRIAVGSFQGGGTVTAQAEDGELQVSWSVERSDFHGTELDDLVHIMAYQPAADEFFVPNEPALRGDGEVAIEVPQHLLGDKAHAWLFFTDRKMKKVSRSVYLGEIELI